MSLSNRPEINYPLKRLVHLIALSRMRKTFTVHWCMALFGTLISTETDRGGLVRGLRRVLTKRSIFMFNRSDNNYTAEQLVNVIAFYRMHKTSTVRWCMAT